MFLSQHTSSVWQSSRVNLKPGSQKPAENSHAVGPQFGSLEAGASATSPHLESRSCCCCCMCAEAFAQSACDHAGSHDSRLSIGWYIFPTQCLLFLLPDHSEQSASHGPHDEGMA